MNLIGKKDLIVNPTVPLFFQLNEDIEHQTQRTAHDFPLLK